MRIIVLITVAIVLVNCRPNHEHSHDNHNDIDNQESTQAPIDIIGKTIEYKYGESIYHLTIDSEIDLHWEAMTGGEKGAIGVEKYIMDRLPNGEIFITWGEENGIGVSQILDFKNGKVYNHLLREREASTGPGEIKILK